MILACKVYTYDLARCTGVQNYAEKCDVSKFSRTYRNLRGF